MTAPPAAPKAPPAAPVPEPIPQASAKVAPVAPPAPPAVQPLVPPEATHAPPAPATPPTPIPTLPRGAPLPAPRPQAAEPLIRAAGLSKRYGSGETAVHALKEFNVTAQPGEFVAIMGPSGCGKSTFLNLLGELNRTQGTTIAVVTHDRRVAQATQRIFMMRDGYLVGDHRVGDPMDEDLRMLANSRQGQAIVDNGSAPLVQMTPEEERLLHALLQRTRTAGAAQLHLRFGNSGKIVYHGVRATCSHAIRIVQRNQV